jgi:hypothetical protein
LSRPLILFISVWTEQQPHSCADTHPHAQRPNSFIVNCLLAKREREREKERERKIVARKREPGIMNRGIGRLYQGGAQKINCLFLLVFACLGLVSVEPTLTCACKG